MMRILNSVLVGIVLGLASLSVSAQLDINGCGPGGQVTSGGEGPGVMGGFCYYGDGSCESHPRGYPPYYCLDKWKEKSANRVGSSGRSKPPPPLPSPPSKWGAVAWNLDTGVFDTSIGESSKEEAERVALQKCGKGCEIFKWYSNQCVAAAWGRLPDSYILRRIETGLVRSLAEKNALNACNKEAKDCQIIFSECSTLYPEP